MLKHSSNIFLSVSVISFYFIHASKNKREREKISKLIVIIQTKTKPVGIEAAEVFFFNLQLDRCLEFRWKQKTNKNNVMFVSDTLALE